MRGLLASPLVPRGEVQTIRAGNRNCARVELCSADDWIVVCYAVVSSTSCIVDYRNRCTLQMSAPSQKEYIRKLIRKRDSMQSHIRALTHQINGIEIAIQLLEQPDESDHGGQNSVSDRRVPGGGTTETIKVILRAAGARGLTARQVVKEAMAGGQVLKPASVASVLSRLKQIGKASYADGRYALVEFKSAARETSISAAE